ncbi:MAG: hypothetical protein AAF558_15710 [Verrucomicrobiota bacterium]
MPQADKSGPKPSSGRSEFEGKSYPTNTPELLDEALRYAFDYRGDITLELENGDQIEGFVHNFDLERDVVELFVKESKRVSNNESLPASKIKAVHFSGDDKAFGKSWDDWMTKSERQRQAEADRLEKEAIDRGHL